MAGRRLSRPLAGLLLAALLPAAWAGDDGLRPGHEGLADVDALASRLREVQPGRLLKLELDDEHGRIVYEVRLLTEDGRVVELELDARSLEVMDRRSGHHDRRRRESHEDAEDDD